MFTNQLALSLNQGLYIPKVEKIYSKTDLAHTCQLPDKRFKDGYLYSKNF